MARLALAVAALVAVAAASIVPARRFNEVWSRAEEDARGVVRESRTSPLPREYIPTAALPASFTWGNKDGRNYLTKSLNQHIPQYCGSCWAHGAISALGDRIKIARPATTIDINLSIQYILNCGTAGSCHGGSATAVYEYIKKSGRGVPFDTCNPYLACSSESREGICPHADWSCSKENICRTCSTFPPAGKCVDIDYYPNATVAEYGEVQGEEDMMKEIYARGPIAAGIDASQILDYSGGVTGKGAGCDGVDHIVSIVGWGVDNSTNTKYWIVRNSWGEYWGEMGYVRVAKGNNDLCLESMCSWATPAAWTERNAPCDEDGHNCDRATTKAAQYVDPSVSRSGRPEMRF